MINFFKKKKRFYSDIDPDEIFLDSENLSSLDTQQLEGKIERPISKKTIYLLFGSFIFVCLIFLGSAFYHAGEEKWMLAWTFGGIGSVGIFSMFSWYIYKKHSGSGGGHD